MTRRPTPLRECDDPERFGGKAAALGACLRAGLPAVPGFALDWETVAALAADLEAPVAWGALPFPCAARSSAVGEDGATASFAASRVTT